MYHNPKETLLKLNRAYLSAELEYEYEFNTPDMNHKTLELFHSHLKALGAFINWYERQID